MTPNHLLVCKENFVEGDIVMMNRYYISVNEFDEESYSRMVRSFCSGMRNIGRAILPDGSHIIDRIFDIKFKIFVINDEKVRIDYFNEETGVSEMTHLGMALFGAKYLNKDKTIGWTSRYLIRVEDVRDPFDRKFPEYNPCKRRM